MLINDPETSSIPIIMVTTEDKRRLCRGLRQGAVDYLVKPVSRHWLEKAQACMTSTMSRACNQVRGLRDLRSKELEKRSRAATTARLPSQCGARMGGSGISHGPGDLLAAREENREVSGYCGGPHIPGAKSWVKGLANIRGQSPPTWICGNFWG